MTVLRFLQVNFRPTQSPNSKITITTVGITTPMAIFWYAMWIPGLLLDVGADTTLDSVEDVDSED